MALAAAAVVAACGGGTTPFESFKPDRVIVFGDETSAITADGRKFSVNALGTNDAIDCVQNPIWVQTVVGSYSYVFAECNPGGTGDVKAFLRAAAGAKVADVTPQISAQAAAGGINNRDLATVLAGANDILELYAQFPGRPRAELVAEARARGERLAQQVNRLVDLGARVIVATLPDIGLSPFAAAQKAAFTDTDRAALISELVAAFNGRVRANILNDGRFVGLVLADEMVQSMVRSPISFGLNNATSAVCTAALPDCTTRTLVEAGSALTYLWADDRRLSYAGQLRLGALAQARALNNPF
jgi:phospholipase/lecithinase/hemolysin